MQHGGARDGRFRQYACSAGGRQQAVDVPRRRNSMRCALCISLCASRMHIHSCPPGCCGPRSRPSCPLASCTACCLHCCPHRSLTWRPALPCIARPCRMVATMSVWPTQSWQLAWTCPRTAVPCMSACPSRAASQRARSGQGRQQPMRVQGTVARAASSVGWGQGGRRPMCSSTQIS